MNNLYGYAIIKQELMPIIKYEPVSKWELFKRYLREFMFYWLLFTCGLLSLGLLMLSLSMIENLI